MLEFFADTFTPYPFVAAGAIVDDDSIGYALETQTRPIYSRAPARGPWPTSWRTSGSATPSAPRGGRTSGSTRAGPPTARGCGQSTAVGRACSRRSRTSWRFPPTTAFWQLDVTDPQPLGLFDDAVYDRGAAAIHALRTQWATRTSSPATRLWLTRYKGRTATHRGLPAGLRGGVRPGSRRVLRHLAAPAREALAALTVLHHDCGRGSVTQAFDALVRAGKIRAIGLSNFTADAVRSGCGWRPATAGRTGGAPTALQPGSPAALRTRPGPRGGRSSLDARGG